MPTILLCAHSIELSLKSLLLQMGVDEKSVRQLGHKLRKLQDQAEELLSGTDIEDEVSSLGDYVLDLCDDLLNSQTLRYGDTPRIGEAPTVGALLMTTEGYQVLSVACGSMEQLS